MKSKASTIVSQINDSERLRDFKALAQDSYVDSSADYTEYWLNEKSLRIGLGFISAFTVVACCFISQLIAEQAKKSKLKLNKHYSKKKYEKDQLIQFISKEQQLYAYHPEGR